MADTQAPVDRQSQLDDIGNLAVDAFPEAVSASQSFGELTLTVELGRLLDVMRFLHDDPNCLFVNFVDACGADYPERPKRFDMVYHFLSPSQNVRIRVKTQTDETKPVPSVSGIWPAATWFEREAYDLYGILFSGNPDFRRLLTDYGFEGHPLRKDFPLTGYVELRYDDEQKRVVYEPVKMNQEFRNLDFMSPWEGAEYLLPGDEKAEGKSYWASTTFATSPSILVRSTPQPTAFCAWCWSSTARWSNGSIPISDCYTGALRSSSSTRPICRPCPILIGSTMWRR